MCNVNLSREKALFQEFDDIAAWVPPGEAGPECAVVVGGYFVTTWPGSSNPIVGGVRKPGILDCS